VIPPTASGLAGPDTEARLDLQHGEELVKERTLRPYNFSNSSHSPAPSAPAIGRPTLRRCVATGAVSFANSIPGSQPGTSRTC
jgi:hypothetical protein